MTAQAAPAFTPVRRALITITLMAGPVMQVLDSSMLSISLKHMQGSLSAAQDQIAWVLTSYLVAVAVTTPLWGALTEKFNRKSLFLFGMMGFTVTSALCGLADGLTEMLIYRALQGVFGAALVPLSQAALYDVYDKKDYGIALSWWGMGLMFGPILGPTLGGYVTEWYSWRWAFFMNVPLGIAGVALTAWMLPSAPARRRRRFNYFGFTALAVFLAALQFVLDRGTRMDWLQSEVIAALSCIAAAAFWLFMVNSVTSKNPFIDPALLANRNFTIGLVLRAMFGVVLFGTLILIPPFLQNVAGYPLIDSGLIMAPRGLATMVSAFIVGRLVGRVDARTLMALGLFMTAASVWGMSTLTPSVTASWVIFLNMVQGFGLAAIFIPLNTVAFATMGPDQRDQGASFFALFGNIGRSVGIAVLSSYLVSQSQTNRAWLTEFATPYSAYFTHQPAAESWTLGTAAGLAAVDSTISFQASFLAYIFDFQLLAIILFCCLPLMFFMSSGDNRTAAA